MYADSTVGFGVNRAVKLISEKNNATTYYYKFGYQGRYSHFYTPDSNGTKTYGKYIQNQQFKINLNNLNVQVWCIMTT